MSVKKFKDTPCLWSTKNLEHRNPAWWGDFSQLQIQIQHKSQFEFVLNLNL